MLLITLVGAPAVRAQFTLSGEFRPRAEYSHGYNRLPEPGQKGSLFVSQRTRLDFSYRGEKLSTGLVLQDARLWGDQPQLVSNHDYATSIHQAWLRYQVTPEFFFKAGRQELAYDNHRILGNVGWSQQGRSHDLLLLGYEGDFTAHAGVAYHENSDRTNNFYLGPDAYKTMQFLWASRIQGDLIISFLFLNNGIPVARRLGIGGVLLEQGISFSQTVGPFVRYSAGNLDLQAAGYFQGGKDGSENTLRAWYGNLEGSFRPAERFAFTGGYEFLSGTAYDEPEVNRSFTPFYGTNHKFNGFMDYFYTGNHLNNVGLQDLYLKGAVKIKRFTAGADIHGFLTAAKLEPDASAYLGTEIDLVVGWAMEETVSLQAGYSHMFAGTSMEILKGGSASEPANWAWLMVTVRPVFFQSGGKDKP